LPNLRREIEGKDVNSVIKILSSNGYNVKVVHRGGTDVVYADGMMLRNYEALEQQKNIHIWRQVQMAIYETMHRHIVDRCPVIQPYSSRKNLEVGDEITYVDINHCYLQMANRLGYISDLKYEKILSKYSTTKIQVCAAITSLFREIKTVYYNEKGRVSREITCDNYCLESAQHNIINFSRKIMYDYCKLGFDYYYRNVDGIVIPAQDRDILLAYMEGYGLKFKEFTGTFLGNGMLYNHATEAIEEVL